MHDPRLEPLLRRYAQLAEYRHVEPLPPGGGFSGAELWRVTATAGTFCLRCWPEEARRSHLAWIHRALGHAAARGCTLLPRPLPDLHGETLVTHGGRMWELTRWIPGEANYHAAPSESRLRAALRALAACHRALADFESPAAPAPSPGLANRLRQLESLLHGGGVGELEQAALHAARRGSGAAAFAERAERVLAALRFHGPEIEGELRHVAFIPLPLQACLRDLWHDHVLFEGEAVTGLLDMGAMRVETVAGDLGRLLGSLAPEDRAGWRIGLEAYETLRPLTPAERGVMGLFDRSGTLLGAVNWLRWVLLEEREFRDPAAALARLDGLVARLRIPSGPRWE